MPFFLLQCSLQRGTLVLECPLHKFIEYKFQPLFEKVILALPYKYRHSYIKQSPSTQTVLI